MQDEGVIALRLDQPGQVRLLDGRVYVREGTPADILAYVDGALLVDLWEDLVLPRSVRSAWAPLMSLASEAGM